MVAHLNGAYNLPTLVILLGATLSAQTAAGGLPPGSRIPSFSLKDQNGTVRFGDDPKTSALDRNCKAHELDNLYVVDASFFPSSGAVNPALTIMANALRVGDHLLERMK
jgi:choline dehydrogenase-like flavoprotein